MPSTAAVDSKLTPSFLFSISFRPVFFVVGILIVHNPFTTTVHSDSTSPVAFPPFPPDFPVSVTPNLHALTSAGKLNALHSFQAATFSSTLDASVPVGSFHVPSAEVHVTVAPSSVNTASLALPFPSTVLPFSEEKRANAGTAEMANRPTMTVSPNNAFILFIFARCSFVIVFCDECRETDRAAHRTSDDSMSGSRRVPLARPSVMIHADDTGVKPVPPEMRVWLSSCEPPKAVFLPEEQGDLGHR